MSDREVVPRQWARERVPGLVAILIAYFAGVWNGLAGSDSWAVVAAATVLMFVATALVLKGRRHAS